EDAVELLDELVGGAEVEVVRLVELHAAPPPQYLLRLVERRAQLARLGLDDQEDVLAAGRDLVRRAEGDVDGVVLVVLAEDGVLALLQHADDLEGPPA